MSQELQKDKLGIAIGNILRYGVWTAFFLSLAGLIGIIIQHGNAAFDPLTLPVQPEKFSVAALWQGILNFNPLHICTLGLLVLLATPLLRVVFALFGYLAERNYLYSFITLIVLLIIGISCWLGMSK